MHDAEPFPPGPADAQRSAAAAATPAAANAACAVGRATLERAAQALTHVAAQLGDPFSRVVALLLACRGHVHIAGLGKSYLVAQKVAATLASTGTPASALHATEAMHGDLGRVQAGDVVLALSHSGQTAEVLQVTACAKRLGATTVAMTAHAQSALGQVAAMTLPYGDVAEAEPLGLVPTTSTTTMAALGDALAMAAFSARGAHAATYAQWHPAGSLGRRLQPVAQRMRTGALLPLAADTAPLSAVLRIMTETPGRPGAACIVDDAGRLCGLFTDGDLRRCVRAGMPPADAPIGPLMHRAPRSIDASVSVHDAALLLATHGVDQVPVVDEGGRPIGLLDVQDVL